MNRANAKKLACGTLLVLIIASTFAIVCSIVVGAILEAAL